MYKNIGKKIQDLAVILFALGVAVTGYMTLTLWNYNQNQALTTLVIGVLISWASTFVLYGFGSLINRCDSIFDRMKDTNEEVIELLQQQNTILRSLLKQSRNDDN